MVKIMLNHFLLNLVSSTNVELYFLDYYLNRGKKKKTVLKSPTKQTLKILKWILLGPFFLKIVTDFGFKNC